MNTNLFQNKSRGGSSVPKTPLDTLVEGISGQLRTHGTSFVSSKVAKAAISMEA